MTELIKYNIYKITNFDGRVYIGSTKQTIKSRFQQHKSKTFKGVNGCSCGDFDFNTAKIEILNTIYVEDDDEAKKIERLCIENNNCVNHRKPYLTEEEKRISRREWLDGKGREKYTCICGSTLCIRERGRHTRSKRHQKFINQSFPTLCLDTDPDDDYSSN